MMTRSVLKVAHETAKGLREAGVMTAQTMHDFGPVSAAGEDVHPRADTTSPAPI